MEAILKVKKFFVLSSSFLLSHGVMFVSITVIDFGTYIITTVAELLWILGVQAVSEKNHTGYSSREGLLGGHGYWQWQVLMVDGSCTVLGFVYCIVLLGFACSCLISAD